MNDREIARSCLRKKRRADRAIELTPAAIVMMLGQLRRGELWLSWSSKAAVKLPSAKLAGHVTPSNSGSRSDQKSVRERYLFDDCGERKKSISGVLRPRVLPMLNEPWKKFIIGTSFKVLISLKDITQDGNTWQID